MFYGNFLAESYIDITTVTDFKVEKHLQNDINLLIEKSIFCYNLCQVKVTSFPTCIPSTYLLN